MREDWISTWWQAALLPDVWDVCGIRVPSLTVWHTFALENVGNAYLLGRTPDRDDAAGLLLFASHGYVAGKRMMLDAKYRARRILRMYRYLRRREWQEVDAACREYVQTCTRTTSRWQKGDSKPAAVPYQWHLVRVLTGGDVRRLVAAWDTPYAVAKCLYDAGAEAAGDDSLMSPAAQEMEDNWDDYKDVTGTKTLEIG